MFLDEMFSAMPWEKFDNVVFDIGNVLMEYNPQRYVQLLFAENPQLQRDLILYVHHSPYWLCLDNGTLNRQEAILDMTMERKDLRAPAQLLLDHFIRLSRPEGEGIVVAERCRRNGKKRYLLSNYHEQAFEELRAVFPLVNEFDGSVISALVHQMKPNDNIFQTLIKKYDLNLARTVFIDDDRENAEAAIRNGLAAVWYREKGQLERFFGKE